MNSDRYREIKERLRVARACVAAVGVVLALALPLAARADGRSAAHNLFANLARAKASLSVNENTALVSPTLVRGIYSISNQQGRFVGFTNEAGTLFGDSRGFNVVSANGAQPRALALDEVADLRQEVMERIDYDKLVRVVYGDGGGRRLLVFSAVDCPHCSAFEDSLRKASNGLGATFYVVPSSLQPLNAGGGQAWQTATRIWCAVRPGDAWQAYWASRATPPVRQCRFEPRTAELAAQQLKDILGAVGVRVYGTPQVVREDGVLVTARDRFDSGFAAATFGTQGGPQLTQKPPKWLLASAEDSFQAQAVGGSPAAPGNASARGKVSSADILKKLLH